jgi:hypothetical protein
MTLAIAVAVALVIRRVRERRRLHVHRPLLGGIELELAVCRQLYGTTTTTATRVPLSAEERDTRRALASRWRRG